MEFNTKGGMDTQVCTYSRYNSEEMVYADGNAKRDNKLGRAGSKV
jgi:hypothetical protein